MEDKIRHRLLILVSLLVVVGGITMLLNNASYNPDFSFIDVISGATKKSHKTDDENEFADTWKYTMEDVALTETENYNVIVLTTESGVYRLLFNSAGNSDNPTLLSNKGNEAYQTAVEDTATYLEELGYNIRIKECSENMMLSLVHAGCFDYFLMSAEVN